MQRIIDASGMVAGRLASHAAKLALKGSEVCIVNAEKAVISGNPKHVLKRYREMVDRGDPYHGPFYPKTPERMLKRIIRGMLPYKKPRGREAFKRVKVFLKVPDELNGKDIQRLSGKMLESKSISLGRLSTLLGAKKTW